MGVKVAEEELETAKKRFEDDDSEIRKDKLVCAEKLLEERNEAKQATEAKKLPTMQDFETFEFECRDEDWYKKFETNKLSMIGRKRFLIICQILLIWFLGLEAFGEG